MGHERVRWTVREALSHEVREEGRLGMFDLAIEGLAASS
jgi:hypothetical protein